MFCPLFSDVYAFGVGDQVNKEQLNALASKKSGETHVFFLRDYETLGEVFNSIISRAALCLCVCQRLVLYSHTHRL